MVTAHNLQHTVRGNMSLYAEYIAELGKDKIIESPSGFATYRYLNEGRSVYLIDVYIIPSERKKGAASYFADMIIKEAKERGCTEFLGSVEPSSPGSTISLKVQLAYGMHLHSAANNAIILRKDI